GRLVLRDQRHPKHETGARALPTRIPAARRELEGRSLAHGELTRDRQPQPAALRAPPTAGSRERLEDGGAELGRDTRTVVGDRDRDALRTLPLDAQVDGATIG